LAAVSVLLSEEALLLALTLVLGLFFIIPFNIDDYNLLLNIDSRKSMKISKPLILQA